MEILKQKRISEILQIHWMVLEEMGDYRVVSIENRSIKNIRSKKTERIRLKENENTLRNL